MNNKLWVCVVVCALGAPAWADDLQEAKSAFADGRASFERGDYERALTQFQRADVLAPAPSLSYNIGKTYEKLGRYRAAVTAFERYLEQMGTPQNDEDRKFQDDLKLRIEANRKQPDRAPGPAPQPQPQPQPQPSYQQPQPQPQPYYYQPAYNPYAYQVPIVNPRAVRLAAAKAKKDGGVKGLIVGSVFMVVGAACIGGASPLTKGFKDFSGDAELGGVVLLTFGVMFEITGLIILPIGIAKTVSGASEYNKIMKEPVSAALPPQPQAWLFPLYSTRF